MPTPPPPLHLQRLWRGIGWALVAVVLGLCLMPAPPTPPVITSDKAHHLIAFAGLLWWWRSVSRRWWSPHVALGFAILIEVLQGTCTANRRADVADIVADGLGLVIGELLYQTPLRQVLPWIDDYLAGPRTK